MINRILMYNRLKELIRHGESRISAFCIILKDAGIKAHKDNFIPTAFIRCDNIELNAIKNIFFLAESISLSVAIRAKRENNETFPVIIVYVK